MIDFTQEFSTPANDKSLYQASKVKALMGPVTSFWFDRVVPYIMQTRPDALEPVFKFAKHECEAAVHKDDASKLFAVACIENKFDIDKTIAQFDLPNDVANALEGIGKIGVHSAFTPLRLGKWAKRTLLPMIKAYKSFSAKQFIDAILAIARRADITVHHTDLQIHAIDSLQDQDVEPQDEEQDTAKNTFFVNGVFKQLDDNTFLVIEGEPQDVAQCFNYPKSVLPALKRPLGMYAKLLKKCFVSIKKDDLVLEHVKSLSAQDRIRASIATLDTLDVLSFSSVNRPMSLAVPKLASHRRNLIEYLVNPFAHFTELKRSSHTAFFVHPVCWQERRPVRLRLRVDGVTRPELPLIQATVLMLDHTDPETDVFLNYITGLPVSLSGDGYVVSSNWEKTVHIDGFDLSENVYKLQAPGRAKGIKIGEFDKCFAPFNGRWIPIDVIQNTQGKRKNKLACIVAACMRLLQSEGVDMPVIDIEQALDEKFIQDVLDKCRVQINFPFGGKMHTITGYVGIQKFFIDNSMDYNARIDGVAVDYAQAKIVEQILGLDKAIDRLPMQPENQELAARALDWIRVIETIAQDLKDNAQITLDVPKNRIPKDQRLAVLASIAPASLASLIDALNSVNVEALNMLVNMQIEFPSMHSWFSLKPLNLLCKVDDEIMLHDFAHALLAYFNALVDYASYPTEYTKHWLAIQLAKLTKSVCMTFTKAMTQPRGFAIVGRHATSSADTVLVPEKLYYQCVALASQAGQMKDNVWIAVRHPIVGAMPKVKVQPARTKVILIPKDIAKDIDGDDDGDIVSVFPI